jgi:hypothetical protein
MEFEALRRELQLRIEYQTRQDERAAEAEKTIAWLRERVDDLAAGLDAERARADRAEDTLKAERQRLSYRIIDPLAHALHRVIPGARLTKVNTQLRD